MKPIIVYCYPNLGPSHDDSARRFVSSYLKHRPKIDHMFFIMVNGGDFHSKHYEEIFSQLDCIFVRHDNTGFDIGAFQLASQYAPKDCDLMMFFGASAYIRHPRWLDRAVESFQAHGDTLYGSMGTLGNGGVGVHPHIRTTGFWMSPALLNKFPYWVHTEHRYNFEHGPDGLTSWIITNGKKPWIVSAEGAYPFPLWGNVPGGYQNGIQQHLLTGDRLTRPPFAACE